MYYEPLGDEVVRVCLSIQPCRALIDMKFKAGLMMAHVQLYN